MFRENERGGEERGRGEREGGREGSGPHPSKGPGLSDQSPELGAVASS